MGLSHSGAADGGQVNLLLAGKPMGGRSEIGGISVSSASHVFCCFGMVWVWYFVNECCFMICCSLDVFDDS